MTILTSVYVIATFAIVYMNRLTIKEMEKGREEESRPYLFANLERDSRDMCFYLKLKNYGKTGCRIENISIEPNMKFVHDIILNERLPGTVIAPGQMLRFIIVEKWELTCKNNYLIEISYTEMSNSKKVYSEKYKVITQYSSLMGYTDSQQSNLSPEANEFKRIADYLDAIRNKIS